ncbi:MAG: hypothetical protein ACK4RK_03400 [Gemmataceae bacterium]
MKRMLATGLGLWLGWSTTQVSAEEIHWRPAATAPRSAPAVPPVTLGKPIAVGLGRPIPHETRRPTTPPSPYVDDSVVPAAFSPGSVSSGRPVVRGQNPDTTPLPMGPHGPSFPPPPTPVDGSASVPQPTPIYTHPPAGYPTAPQPHAVYPYDPHLGEHGSHTTSMTLGQMVPMSPEEHYNYGIATDPVPVAGVPIGPLAPVAPAGVCPTGAPLFGMAILGNYNGFRSDHCFDNFISPLSNPFLFEDPRALTEVRPIFLYQGSASSNPLLAGGDLVWFGAQARVAITDRLSFVIQKFGWQWLESHVPGIESHVGFSEIFMGPKYTFLRSESTGSVGAVGLQFQIPAGPQKVFQNTGDLSLNPYISFAQNFLKSSYGSFNAMASTGVNVRADNKRSEYYWASLHLDYDVANAHKIYPLIELNWYHYTRSGKVWPLDFEGRDLINFGSTNVAGNNNVNMAAGVRYKFSEAAQLGFGVEFPLAGRRDLLDYRIMVDFIVRY